MTFHIIKRVSSFALHTTGLIKTQLHISKLKYFALVMNFFIVTHGYAQTTVTEVPYNNPPTTTNIIVPPGITPPATTTTKETTVTTTSVQPTTVTTTTPAETAADTTQVISIIPSGGRVSFNFQNVPIKTLLQLIAKTSGENFIISDAIKGNTTLNLKDVTWHQALDIVLRSNGLSSQKIGNAVFISTTEDITQKQAKELQSEQTLESLAPITSTLVTLKYAEAEAMSKLIKGEKGTLLTSRGEVAFDSLTNSLIIRDVRSNLNELVRYVRRLDIPAKQVSIEARIVNVDITYEAQLGVRFGISNTRSLSGTLNGANQLAQGIDVSEIDPLSNRLNFNIPAAVLSSGTPPASIGLALARLGPVLLDLELSALEEEGFTQIISKPRVVTANQQKALIQTGEEIPYQQATSSGATAVEFKKAVLSLEIVPQITPDNRIVLRLKANQDSRGQSLIIAQGSSSGGTTIPTAFGPPTINTQEVESSVLLNDNETVVIGGIYRVTKQNTYDRVPFFSDIPLLGRLFKHRGIKNERTELLIFLTPRIIKSQPVYAHAYRVYKGEG